MQTGGERVDGHHTAKMHLLSIVRIKDFEVRVDHFPCSGIPVEGHHTAAHHACPHRKAFLEIRAARLKPFTDQGATVVLQQQSHKRFATFFAGLRLQRGHGATKGLPLAPPQAALEV